MHSTASRSIASLIARPASSASPIFSASPIAGTCPVPRIAAADATLPGVGHYVPAYRLGGVDVRRLDGGRRRRVERALELIRGSSRPLAEIACVTGFSRQAQMSNAVKTAIALTPSALRADV